MVSMFFNTRRFTTWIMVSGWACNMTEGSCTAYKCNDSMRDWHVVGRMESCFSDIICRAAFAEIPIPGTGPGRFI